MPGGGSGMPMQVTTMALKKAVGMRFGILSDKEIRRMSVAEIKSEHLLDKNNLPQFEGIHDSRMGTTDRDSLCGSCGCSYIECPGHFGHIELAQGVYHGGFATSILNVLRCICCECGALKLRDKVQREQIKRVRSGRTRFRKIKDTCMKIKECQSDSATGVGCGHPQPNYRKLGLNIWREYQGNTGPTGPQSSSDPKRVLKPDEVRRILCKISDEDLKMMGFDPKHSRPEWMVITALAVAPPPVRPSVQAGDGVRSEDDLTYAYRMVVRTNNELRRYMEGGQPEKAQEEVLRNLQLLVATLMDNNIQDQPRQRHTSSGKPIKDIRSRLKGKEGRVRGNLMGKRVDFSARTVITPDPILQLDQLGVPEAIAMNLTVPEHVTRENMAVMRQLVTNGPNKWPGAKYIIRHDGKQIDLANLGNRANAHLDPGYIVERQLRDDDWVIFNRQPSLHKMSLMGHRVKVLPFMTFRLNLSVTSPYNADFDGDEMNMHVPQNYETKAEIKEIMAVPRQIVAPKDNKPVMGIVQDSMLGIMLMTKRDTFIELDAVMNLMMWVNYTGRLPSPAILKPRPLWTGKQILQLVIPNINYHCGKKIFNDPKDQVVIIKNGEFLCGQLIKKNVGAVRGGIVHIIWKDLGPEPTKLWFSDTQNIVNNWIINHGFTIGVQDIIATPQTVSKITKLIEKYKRKVTRITQKTQRGMLQTLPGMSMYQSFENEVNTELRNALNLSGSLANRNLKETNKLKCMVFSGSKGSNMNISQIMACVGQQNVEGKRIPFGFDRRSLPHFSKDDFGPESKGFVQNCYVSGLTPQEFYFHAMGGREGLIDTACKTAETGYIQRRLIKALEDIQCRYDSTVRTSKDQIIQLIYGEDGMDATYIENLSIPLLKMNNKTMEQEYKFFGESTDMAEQKMKLKEFIPKKIVDEIEDFPGLCEKLQNEYANIEQDRHDLRSYILQDGEDDIFMPVNLERIIQNAKMMFQIKNRQMCTVDPNYVIDKVQELMTNGIKVYQQCKMDQSQLFVDANNDATWLFKIYMRTQLCAKHVIQNHRLSKESFDFVLGEIQTRYEKSLVNAGEMVGSIGAQSMGEPATQMTLNTFHSAGVASKNVTLGVPRLKEVINVAKTIKTPSVRVYIDQDLAQDEKIAHDIGNKIEHSTLAHVVTTSAIYYDPDPKETIIKADKELLEFHNMTSLDEIDGSKLSPWLIRFELDAKKMMGRSLSIEQIDNRLHEIMADDPINIVRHRELQENSGKLVLRLRLPDISADEDDDETVPMMLKQAEDKIMNELTLKGIPEISKVAYTNMAPQCKIKVYNKITGEQQIIDKNWIIETDGVALKKIIGIENVDHARTVSNDIIETLTVLGVEAARLSLIAEIRFVLGSYDIYVNYRHLSTLCDIMTNRGILTSITRHGINRVDSGALRKCSFEETVEILLEASQHAEVDHLTGITENIIFGQMAPYGTGCFDVIVDSDMLKEANDGGMDDMNIVPQQNFNLDQMDAGTPEFMTPQMPIPGGTTAYMNDGSAYQAFTPMPGADGSMGYNVGMDSPVQGSPTQTEMYRPIMASTPIHAGATPGPAGVGMPGGGASGYQANTPAYPRAGGSTPGYPTQSPGYYAPRGGPSAGPSYTPYSPTPYGMGGAGGRTPGYQPGNIGGASPSYRPAMGQSPTYRPAMGQSPVYSPGNAAYSPTQNLYNQPEPYYNPMGQTPGLPKTQDKKDQDKK